jgi:hypothetical protein
MYYLIASPARMWNITEQLNFLNSFFQAFAGLIRNLNAPGLTPMHIAASRAVAVQ